MWEEAVRITMDMIDNVWKNAEEVYLDHVNETTLSVRHHVLARAWLANDLA